MSEQLPLFPPNVRATDPDTSHAAAGLQRVTLRRQVERVLRDCPAGATDHEITVALGLDLRRKPSVGKRRQELGAVDTSLRRPSPDGSPCIVWRLDGAPPDPVDRDRASGAALRVTEVTTVDRTTSPG